MAINLKSGQAAVEFAIGLLVILLVVSGLVEFTQLIRASLDLQGELRGKAGVEALTAAVGQTPAYIRDWDAGDDKIPFTPDDTPKHGDYVNTVTTLAAASASSADDWAYPAANTFLGFSMLGFHDVPAAPVSFAGAKDSADVEVDPFAAKYLFGDTKATVKEEVYMPVMEGLL